MANHIHFNRENALMTLRYAALTAVAAFGLAACGSDNTTASTQPGVVSIRFVNSAYNQDTTIDLSSNITTYSTPTAIDILIDSLTAAPSQIAMAANTVAGGSSGPNPAKLNALYENISVGVHGFVARVAGGTNNPSFFTTSSSTQYLPRQYLTAGTFYTFIVAGQNAVQSHATGAAAVLASSSAFPFTLLVDDPFTPPTTNATGSTVLQARFRIINAAPFASGSSSGNGASLSIYLTPSGITPVTPPTSPTSTTPLLSTQTNLASASFRNASAYMNVTAGTYVLTISQGTSRILYQASITLGAGEVRSMVLQNNISSTVTLPYTPVMNTDFKLTNIKDNQY